MATTLNHDYPFANNLAAVNESGDPVEGAQIRVYDKTAFDAGLVDTWVGATVTDLNGEWVDPIIVDDANTWVVHFQKPTEYGPVHREVTT